MSNTIDIKIGEETHAVSKAKLKTWLQLTDTYEKFLKESKAKNYVEMVHHIETYLTIALSGISFNFDEIGWMNVLEIFASIISLNMPSKKIPIMGARSENKDEPWDYEGRSWYSWAHLLASSYGWSLSEIENLEVEDAISLMQEIGLANQFEKEFTWMLSEIAYPYNAGTKKSEFKPLPRPNWMLPKTEIKKVMIPKAMLPMGVVENVSGMFSENVVKNDA